MSPALTIAIYSVLTIVASLFGGAIPSLLRLTHLRLQLMMSAVGGLMLGIAVFHLLPHALNEQVSLDRAAWWLAVGLLTTFFLIRTFHSHQHGTHTETSVVPCADDPCETAPPAVEHVHSHHGGAAHVCSAHGEKSRWIGVFIGLSLHTLLDGVALGAAVLHDYDHSPGALLMGFAVFVGVFLHKPLDSLSIAALMESDGWSRRAQIATNVAYALMCPIGAAAFFAGLHGSAQQDAIVGCSLAFAAGIFLCISLSDLLPELEFHSHDRLKLSAALLVGVSLAYAVIFLEPEHVHSRSSSTHEEGHDSHGGHEDHGHAH